MNDQFKNWLDLDIDQLETKPLTELQKRKIKNHVTANSKRKMKKFNTRLLASAALLGLSIAAASFFALPTIAGQIPFIQDVLTYFEDEELPVTYTNLATAIDEVQSSSGIDVMIENAVYDGTNLIITYAIQTELPLGDNPYFKGWVDIEESVGAGGSSSIEKINDTTYVGVEKVTPHFKDGNPDVIHVQWTPQAFINSQTSEETEGDWQFEFALSQLTTTLLELNESVEHDGITLTMKSLEHSQMAAVLEYEFDVEESILQERPYVSIEMTEVKDDLGNIYEVHGNGGTSYDNGTSNESKATIYSLDKRASTLTIIPEIYYSTGSGKSIETTPMRPITINLR